MKAPFLLIAALLVATPSIADVWKAAARGARQDAHYLINTDTGAIAFMRGERCLRSFTGKLLKGTGPGGVDQMQVDSEISGGAGPRGTQRMLFTLREGAADIAVDSSYRGARPPLPGDYRITCRGKACAMPACE